MSTETTRARHPMTWVPTAYFAEGIPFAALTGYDVPRLYALKGEVVRRGVRAVTGFDMPIFPKRRFQHGALPAERLRSRLGGDEDRYRRRFFALQA